MDIMCIVCRVFSPIAFSPTVRYSGLCIFDCKIPKLIDSSSEAAASFGCFGLRLSSSLLDVIAQLKKAHKRACLRIRIPRNLKFDDDVCHK